MGMRKFEEKLERMKKEFEQIDKDHHIPWIYRDSDGFEYKGDFAGSTVDGKPHGLGRFTCEEFWINAEWKEGEIDGIAIREFTGSKDCEECEMRGGKYEGKYMLTWRGGNREEREYKNGKMHGRQRFVTRDDSVEVETFYREGKVVRRIN